MSAAQAQKRTYEKAFVQKKLNTVKVGDFYSETTIYKVVNEMTSNKNNFNVITTANSKFQYGSKTITDVARSASIYESEMHLTKTDLIKLFSVISTHDVWSAVFYKLETETNWHDDLVTKIQSMEKKDAVKFMKMEFKTLGKTKRELTGNKLCMSSDNNYYTVRDLNLFFNELEKTGNSSQAEKISIRNLDVNTIQTIIFNGVKYTLK